MMYVHVMSMCVQATGRNFSNILMKFGTVTGFDRRTNSIANGSDRLLHFQSLPL